MDSTFLRTKRNERVHKKFMQPSMLSTSQLVRFLQIDTWKDTNIRLSCVSVMQCKKRYDQGLSMRKKIPIWELFFAFPVC